MGKIVAQLVDISKDVLFGTYQKRSVLEQIDLQLIAGQVTTLVGRNGVGKSTLARVIAGIEEPSRGVIRWSQKSDGRVNCALAHQEVDESLFPWLRNVSNIALGLEATGMPRGLATQQAVEFVSAYGLPIPLQQHPSLSSGGERQMVCVVRAAIVRPRLLILDEPFARIDPSQVWIWRNFLRCYSVRENVACLVITHDLDDALYIADRISVMSKKADSGGSIRHTFRLCIPDDDRVIWRRSSEYNQLRQDVLDAIDATE